LEDKKKSIRRVEEMAKTGLVPVSYGYKRMTADELKMEMADKDPESPEFKESLLTDLSYICTFGLENPLRLHVDEDVSLIKYGHKKNDEEPREGGEQEHHGEEVDEPLNPLPEEDVPLSQPST
jgi:hypothetical protein